MVDNRTNYIQYGLNNNIPIEAINQSLAEFNFKPLSKVEVLQINDGTFGMNVGERFGKGASDLGAGLRTILGGVGQAIKDPKVAGAALGQARQYLSSHSTGDMVLDLANAILNPYNELNVQKALTQPIGETLTDIQAGAVARPFNATLDTLPIIPGVGKALGSTKAGRRIINAGKESLDKLPLPKTIKSVIPGTKESQINDILNTSKYAPAAKVEGLQNLNAKVKQATTEDIAKAIKNLEEGTREGTEAQIRLTNELQELSKNIDSTLEAFGYSPTTARNTSYSQYITRQLQKEGKNIPVAEINKYLNNNDYIIEGVDKARLNNLQLEAKNLFDNGLIYPVRHNTTATTAREGFLDEATKRSLGKNEKIYGTQSYDDLAKGFKESGYDNIVNKFNKAQQTTGAIDEIAINVGKKVDDISNINLAKDEVIISPTLLKQKFGTSLLQGTDINKDIQSLSRGLNKAEIQRYADDLYVLNKKDLGAVEKAFSGANKSNPFVSTAKRGILSTPRYLAGNWTTNIGMNLTEGVGLGHYADALKYREAIPKALNRSTTFSGYLGKEAKSDSGLKEIYNNLFDKIQTGTPGEKLEALQQITTTPIFKSAGSVEFLDRSANYLYQAEKYAKETGKTVQEVLEAGLKNNGNNNTYRTLLNRVNNTLGDYAGTNYYAPQLMKDIASNITLFYRPYTQGARQLISQAANYPIRNYIFNRIPANIGNDISNYAQENFNVTPDNEGGGGFPVLPGYGQLPSRVIYNPYHAYSAVGELFTNPTSILTGNLMGVVPMLGLQGKNRYLSEANIPNQMTINGKKVQLDNNGNKVQPSLLDRLQLAGAQSAQAYLAPIAQMNNFVLPTIAAITGQAYRRPYDNTLFGTVGDFRIPGLIDSDPTSKATIGTKNLLPQLGFYERDIYPERQYNLRDIRRARRSLDRRRIRNERQEQ